MFFYREGDGFSQGGVGFLIHKTLDSNVEEFSSVSTRLAYLVLKLSDRYSLKVIDLYAPTSAHPDDEVESLYNDIARAWHPSAFFNVVIGDFNARVGIQDHDESNIGPHESG